MVSDLISRKALLERLEKIYGTNSIVDKIMLRFLKKLIRKQPTVDAVEVVHGEWVGNGIPESVLSECSVCGYSCGSSSFNYCPNCGADMREGRWKGEGMGDFSCSLCGEVVSGNHREKCPNCHAKIDGGDE